MRTTLNIDDDVLAVARSLAAQRQRPVGSIVSDLVRQALTKRTASASRSGVPLLPVKKGAQPITMDMVNELRDQEG
ncbi:MAG: CopG family transcriptional regulator [Gammaproteobacteria bacterium]|nr:CopG family transcriptional regulator [Gammaproteobacteria bacterium]